MSTYPHHLFAKINTPGRRDGGFQFSTDEFVRPPQNAIRQNGESGFFFQIIRDARGTVTYVIDIGASQLDRWGESNGHRELKLEVRAETLAHLLCHGLESGDLSLSPTQASKLLCAIANGLLPAEEGKP